MSLPSLAEVEHADWSALERICAELGLNPKGRSEVVRMRVLDHVRRRVRPEAWRPGVQHQAALLTRLGHPDAAIRLWESTLHLDEPSPWVGLGSAHLGAGDLTEAAKDFDRAIQMGDAAADLHRAESLAASGNCEGAVRACDAYLASRPQDLRGLLLKSVFLARGGWTDEAATVLRDAFEAYPHLAELWRGLGTLLLKGRRFEAAAEAYREALRVRPRDQASWIDRGSALLLGGRTREAIGVFRGVLEQDPRQAIALNNLGVAYLRADQTKSAAVNLERAAKHMETPQILLNVAKVQEATDQRSAALDSYTRLLALKPRDPEATAARKRLQPPRPRRRAPRRSPRAQRRKGPRRRKKTVRTRRKRIPARGRRRSAQTARPGVRKGKRRPTGHTPRVRGSHRR
ncbi:MAG TPA: tetratricopeptide repeat protein [Thermoplasmata archaeon]|nr:tetratricopeptide repeat protein [Thermoplasmata archaeon]